MNEAIFDLSLANTDLYAGCEIQEVAGRSALITPTAQAIHIVGRNAETLVKQLLAAQVESITLTGGMAIWAYLVVFHCVVHRFRYVYYDDGRPNGKVLIAAHP